MPFIVRLSCYLYARLLHLYPLSFRCEFENEMLQCFTQLTQNAWQQAKWAGVFSTWLWISADIMISVTEQRWLFWRKIMFKNSHGKTLLVSMSIFFLVGITLFSYGTYNLVLHPSSYLRKPAVLFSWHSHEKLGYSTFVVSRAENSTSEVACDAMPLSQFQTIPQTNLRNQYFSTTPDSILPAERHTIRDSYQVNRSSTYCYHVEGVEADGSLTSLEFYHWGSYNQPREFVLGNFLAVLGGFLFLFLSIRLNSLTRQLPILQPAA